MIILHVVVTCMTCYDDCDHPFKLLYHGSTVPHLPIELLQLTHFNTIFCVFLRHLLLHLVDHPTASTVVDLLEVSYFAALHTCLAVCWALPWLVDPPTVSIWLSQCGPVHWCSCFVILYFLGYFDVIKLF